jgi:Rnl2 family RNA ligase
MMTDEVPAYEKMVDDPRRWGLDEAALRALSRVTWAVTEKIHGANLCLVVEPGGVRASCRSRWLTPDDDFFGFQAIVARLEGALRTLAAPLLGPDVARVLVYGELFGGAYPHPDVPVEAGVAPVQTGIWYAPGLDFSAFDVALVGAGGKRYLAARDVHERLRGAGVPCTEPLHVGTYTEAMAFVVGGDTVVPARRGLPAIAGNRAEGVVVRPWEPVEVRDASGRAVRPLLKRKLAAFAEDERFHGAERQRAAPAGVWEALVQRAAWMVNEPRLAAARSKLGAVERRGPSGRAELREAIVVDVLDELAADGALDALGASERGRLSARVRDDTGALVELFAG